MLSSIKKTMIFAFGALFAGSFAATSLKQDTDKCYLIGTAADLYEFSKLVNGTTANGINNGVQGACGKLTADITLNEGVLNSDGTLNTAKSSTFKEWTPLGNSSDPFYGSFNGQGHVIKGLYINSADSYMGFIGRIYNSDSKAIVIKDLGFEDSYIKGNDYIGGIIGNVYGGIVEITNCYHIGPVISSRSSGYAGGLVGSTSVLTTTSLTIKNSYHIGSVSTPKKTGGGIIGWIHGSSTFNASNTFFSGQETSATTATGTTAKTATEFSDGTVKAALNGTTGVTWYQSSSSGYPKLNPLKKDANSCYQIGSADDLYTFADFINGEKQDACGKLTADITLNEGVLNSDGSLNTTKSSTFKQWTPIGSTKSFKGTFDGQGHKISGLYYKNSSVGRVGLFGQVAGGSTSAPVTIKRVGLVDSWIEAKYSAGGLVGYAESGTILRIEEAYNESPITGQWNIAGFVGYASGASVFIGNAYNAGSITATSGDGAGFVSSGTNVSITKAFSYGAISATSTKDAFVAAPSSGTLTFRYVFYNSDRNSTKHSADYIFKKTEEEFLYTPDNKESKGLVMALRTTNELLGSTTIYGFVWGQNSKTDKYPTLSGELYDDSGCLHIYNTTDLNTFADIVNGTNGKTANSSACALLETTIYANNGASIINSEGSLNSTDKSKFNIWTPIGTEDHPFSGTFDGQGSSIHGLYYESQITTKKENIGLFGVVAGGSSESPVVIKNVGLSNSYFSAHGCTGGLIGYVKDGAKLEISNSSNKATINGTTLSSGTSYAGGLIGYTEDASLTITKSYNKGFVKNNAAYGRVGGFIGSRATDDQATLKIINSFNQGKINAGQATTYGAGFIAAGNGTIVNSYNYCSFSGNGYTDDIATLADVTLKNVFYNNTSSWATEGAAIASAEDFANGSVARKLHLFEDETNNISGSIWGQDGDLPDYTGMVKANDCYEIYNVDELYKFAGFACGKQACGILKADITINEGVLNADGTLNEDKMNDHRVWTPIGYDRGYTSCAYSGNFDGNGYTIRGLYVNENTLDNVGLFGYVTGTNDGYQSSTIKNVRIEDSYFNGKNHVGAIVGRIKKDAYRNINNSYAISSVVSGTKYVGGLVGTIEEDASVGLTNVYTKVSVSGDFAGGIVGDAESNSSSIENAYSLSVIAKGEEGEEITTDAISNGRASRRNVYNSTNASAKEFANGSIAWKLYTGRYSESIWGQSSTAENSSPNFSGTLPSDFCIEIASKDDLNNFAKYVNNSGATACGLLTDNITYNDYVLNENGTLDQSHTNSEKWDAIGTAEHPFKGTFNGHGYVIKGLYPRAASTSNEMGLFGVVSSDEGKTTTIDSVGLEDSYLSGGTYVGGFIGRTKEGSSVAISNSYTKANISGGDYYASYVAGFVGYLDNSTLTISNSYNVGVVNKASVNAAGFVGYNYGGNETSITISNCYNQGSIEAFGEGNAAGFITTGWGTIINSYNSGTITVATETAKTDDWGTSGRINLVNTYYSGTSSRTEGTTKVENFSDGIVAISLHNYTDETYNVNGSIWGQASQKEGAKPDFSGEITDLAFKVSFQDEDESELGFLTVKYNQLPDIEELVLTNTPAKEQTVSTVYTFDGWTPKIAAVTGPTKYTVKFKESPRPYTIRFVTVKDDGTEQELQSGAVAYGTLPKYTKDAPSKESTAQYDYTFEGWNKDIKEVTDTVTYKATFTETLRKYEVTFYDDDESTILKEPVTYKYGEIPVKPEENPTKEATDQYTYTFARWSPNITKVTGTTNYHAVYSRKLNKYAVSVDVNEEEMGEAVITSTGLTTGEFAYGSSVKLSATAKEHYHFVKWSDDIKLAKRSVTVKGKVEVTANFAPDSYKIALYTNGGTIAEVDDVTSYTFGVGANLPTATRDGYSFGGWYEDISFTGSAATVISDAEVGNKEFFAKWDIIKENSSSSETVSTSSSSEEATNSSSSSEAEESSSSSEESTNSSSSSEAEESSSSEAVDTSSSSEEATNSSSSSEAEESSSSEAVDTSSSSEETSSSSSNNVESSSSEAVVASSSSEKTTSSSSSDSAESSSSAVVASSSSEEATNSSSSDSVESSSSAVVASSSSEEAASSSSRATESSSSATEDDSSSSSEDDDGIVVAARIPNVSFSIMGRTIQIAGAKKGSVYAILDLQGSVLLKGRASESNFNIEVPCAGNYIIRIGNQTQRMSVK